MSVVAAIRAMLAQGLSIDQALAAAEAIEQSAVPKLTSRQERNRRYYEAHRASEKRLNPPEIVLQTSETSELRRSPSPPPSPFPDKEIPQTLLENNPSPLPPPQPFSLSAGDEFERFWEIYPNKVGKADARKKFPGALRKVSIEPMLEALGRYVAKTDDRPWLNPATWLHQERWNDQPAQVARGSPARQREPTASDIFGEISRRLREEPDDEQGTESRDNGPAGTNHRLISAAAKY